MTTSPTHKPTLLPDATAPSARNHILADLEGRKTHSIPSYNRRRSDRASPALRSAVAALAIITCVAALVFFYRTPSASAPVANNSAQPSIIAPASPSARSTHLSAEPDSDTATIITASPVELAADVRASKSLPAPVQSVTPGESASASASPSQPIVALNHNSIAATPTPASSKPNTVKPVANSIPKTDPVQKSTQPDQRKILATTKPVDAATTNNNVDLDVALLTAIIQRARQREAIPTAETAAGSVETKATKTSCVNPALDKHCPR